VLALLFTATTKPYLMAEHSCQHLQAISFKEETATNNSST
jgi:hypothetical protein